jgi:hypothetical protein
LFAGVAVESQVAAASVGGDARPVQQVEVSLASLAGSGSPVDPYVVTNASELQAMAEGLDAHYALGNDIDASETATWNGGTGFDPVGSLDDESFTGSFDGRGHAITGLYIDRSEDEVGLFGVMSGDVRDVRLEAVAVTGRDNVGGLIGVCGECVVADVSVTGTVTSTSPSVPREENGVGGVVGKAFFATVTNTSASGTVTGGTAVGGFVGYAYAARLVDSTAAVTVTGTDKVGGFVGETLFEAVVEGSSATGQVSGETRVGGFVGFAGSGPRAIADSSASGAVTGDEDVGGFVGHAAFTDVTNASASGDVTGTHRVGGFAGTVGGFTRVREVNNSIATGAVTGDDEVGGFAGRVALFGKVSDVSASGTVTGDDQVGGLVGQNNFQVADSVASGAVTGDDEVGGLVGRARGVITRSEASGVVSGTDAVGGLVGSASGSVDTSVARGAVQATPEPGDASGGFAVGGLVGAAFGLPVIDSYATGSVTGGTSVGGLVGLNDNGSVTGSYATGRVTGTIRTGGLVGQSAGGETSDSYWDSDATGQEDSEGGTGLTTAQMTGAAAVDSMSGFDVPAQWHLTEGYPALAWEGSGPFLAVEVVGTNSPVAAGDRLRVNAIASSYGGAKAVQTVRLTDTGFGGSQQDAVDIRLDPGDDTSVALSWLTEAGDVGTGAVTVATANDSDAVVVAVRSAPPPADWTLVEVTFDGARNELLAYNVSVGAPGHSVRNVTAVAQTGTFAVVEGGVGADRITVRATDARAFPALRPLFTVEFEGDVTESEVTVAVHDLSSDAGTTPDASQVGVTTTRVYESPFPGPVPGSGGQGPPTDSDGDGRYDDVDGSGATDFDDVIALAFVDRAALTPGQAAALDFDGNGAFEFGDVIELAFGL